MNLLPSDKKSFTLVDFNGSNFEPRHAKVENNHGLLTVSAQKKTRNKRTGERTLRSFLVTISDPSLDGATHEFKDGKLVINPKRG